MEESIESSNKENAMNAEPEKLEENTEKPERKMYPAKCSDCGKDCEVPFEPTEGKPVRCKECFMKSRPRRPGNRFGNRSGGRDRQMFNATCAECKKETQVPFKPNGKKPVLCKDCYIKSK